MEALYCYQCIHCDKSRQNEKSQVRCTRFSRFVERTDNKCDEFLSGSVHVMKMREYLKEGAE